MSTPAERRSDRYTSASGTLSGEAMQSQTQIKAGSPRTPFNWKNMARELPSYPPIVHRRIEEPLGLSFPQQRLWFIAQLHPEAGSVAYNVPMAWRLRGSVRPSALENGLNAIIRRHEALRTGFELRDGQPVQLVTTDRNVEFTVVDLESIPTDRRNNGLQDRLREEIQRPFDLSSDVMLRAALFHLQSDEYVLLLTVHHIACDGPSMEILLRELSHFYKQAVDGLPLELAKPLVQAGDFALWQKEVLTDGLRQKQLAYWTAQLEAAPPTLDLPTDFARPGALSFRGGIVYRALPSELSRDFKSLARQNAVTDFMALLGALQVLLFRLSGQADVVVGASMTNRNREEISGSIGFFSNMMALRTDLQDDPSFSELLKRARSTVLGAYTYQDLPFEAIVAALQPERGADRNPFFQVILNAEDATWHELPLEGVESAEFPVHNGCSRFDLNLSVVDHADGFRLALEYDSDMFEAGTAEKMLERFETVLRGIVVDPMCTVSRLRLLTEDERAAQLSAVNEELQTYPHLCVHEMIEAQVRKTPESTAIEFEGQRVSYSELNRQANQLAAYLAKRGVKAEALVGICLEPSPKMVLAILAVLKAGGAYVPLNPAHPVQRREDILRECSPVVLLTEEKFVGEMVTPEGLKVIPVDTLWPIIAMENDTDRQSPAVAENLAYVMYTSGSTGKPKGVQIEHRNVTNFLFGMLERMGLSANDTMLAITALTFDPSVLELVLPLTVGARVVIAKREDVMDGPGLAGILERSRATVMQATPTSWKMLIGAGWKGNPHLRALCGGEVLSQGLAEQLLTKCGELWNLYGPTETTVWSFLHKVDRDDTGSVPLGSPIPNVQMFVLDPHMQPVLRGVVGELHIGGAGVGRGYVSTGDSRSQELRTKFISNPFCSKPGSRLYRSGDLVRQRPDGSIEFVSRADRQIKIRGNRVEPGEIETVLAQHPGVQNAAVVPRKEVSGGDCLVAYVVLRNAADAQPAALRAFLRNKLPEYMVPAAFVPVSSLPQSSTGKLDWRALPEPDFQAADTAFVSPRDETESRLARIWQEILKLDRVGATSNFFHLGGHSVLGAQLFARIEKEFGKRLALSALFEAPTLEQMAALIRQNRWSTPWLVEIQAGNRSLPPLFLVQEPIGYRHLASELGAEQPVYVVEYDNLYREHTERKLADIAKELAGKIREVQPRGPYFIGGTCLGGWVAFYIASELLRQGEEVGQLAIFDSIAPPNMTKQQMNVRLRRFWDHAKWHIAKLARSNREQRILYIKDRWRTLRWHVKTQLWWRAHSLYVRMGRPLPKRLRHSNWLTAKAVLTAGPADPYPGRIALFRPSERPAGPLDDPFLGWRRIAEQVEFYEVSGDHKHMLLPPNVASLGRELKTSLRQAMTPRREEVAAA